MTDSQHADEELEAGKGLGDADAGADAGADHGADAAAE